MRHLTRQVLLVWAATLAVAGVSLGNTTTYGYGSFTGDDVYFDNVGENSSMSDTPLFGAPTVVGNSLRFAPTQFNCNVQDGDLNAVDGTLDVTITAKPGKTIPTLSIFESGDYTLTGSGTSDTLVSITAPPVLTILEVDGQPLTIPIVMSPGSPLSQWELPGDLGGTWNLTLILDITAELRSSGYQGYATKVQLALDDQLFAESEDGTTADIEKTQADINVPEPATLAMLLVGAVLMPLRRRKETRKKKADLALTDSE